MLNKLYNTLETIPETISSIPTATSIQDVDWLSIAGQSLSCLAPDESDLWKITLYKQGKYIKEQQSLVINFYISTNTAHTLTHTQQHCSQLSICREYRLALFFSLGTKKGTEIELQIVWMEAEGGEKVFFAFFQGLFLHDVFQQLVHSSLKHFCTRRLSAEAAAFSSLKSRTVFRPCQEQVVYRHRMHHIGQLPFFIPFHCKSTKWILMQCSACQQQLLHINSTSHLSVFRLRDSNLVPPWKTDVRFLF